MVSNCLHNLPDYQTSNPESYLGKNFKAFFLTLYFLRMGSISGQRSMVLFSNPESEILWSNIV